MIDPLHREIDPFVSGVNTLDRNRRVPEAPGKATGWRADRSEIAQRALRPRRADASAADALMLPRCSMSPALIMTNDDWFRSASWDEPAQSFFWQKLARAHARNKSIGHIRGTQLRILPMYRHNLIIADSDDNKFTDCAIIAGANFIITQDKDFRVLVGLGYKPQAITLAEFIAQHLAAQP